MSLNGLKLKKLGHFDDIEYDIDYDTTYDTVTMHNGIDLRITPANGGTIVHIKNDDGEIGELYVIDDAKDLGVELGKILTMHLLKKEKYESSR